MREKNIDPWLVTLKTVRGTEYKGVERRDARNRQPTYHF